MWQNWINVYKRSARGKDRVTPRAPYDPYFHTLTRPFLKVARLDFLGGYLPSLSIKYVAMSEDMEKWFPQLYHIKMKNSYDLGFFCNRSRHGNVTTPLRFFFVFVFLCIRSFLRNRLREFVPAIIASIRAKFEQIL